MSTRPAPLTDDEVRALPAMPRAYPVLARLFDVGKTTVAEMIKNDATPIPVVRVGRQLRCRKIDILRFLDLAENDDDAGGATPTPPVERTEIHVPADRK